MERTALTELYNKQSDMYEKLRRKKRTIDYAWRQRLLTGANGNVLEVSVGAGANFKFYPYTANVTAVDISPAMISKAKEAAADAGINAEFITAGIEDLNFAPGSFDTIVSTLSLCAYNDPVQVLQLFSNWCKKEGTILLLEHGASKNGLIHFLQNCFDGLQYRRIGCHANRNILDIVKKSGLQIKRVERKLTGVMYLIWAKP